MGLIADCGFCDDWPVRQGDRFCSGCGAFVAPIRLFWKLEGADGAERVALQASVPPDWSPDDRADLRQLRIAILTPQGDALEPGLTIGALIDNETTPLIEISRARRTSRLRPMSVRVVAGRGRASSTPSPNSLLAMAVSTAPPVLAFSDGADAIVEINGRRKTEVRIRNLGGDVVLTAARVRFDEATGSPSPPLHFDQPLLVETGADAAVQLRIPAADTARILRQGGEFDSELEVVDDAGRRHEIGRLRLTSPAHPAAELFTMQSALAMSGRFVRLAARLDNVGGGVLTAVACGLTLTDEDGEKRMMSLPIPRPWAAGIGRGESKRIEFRPPMTIDGMGGGAPLPIGVHAIELRVELQAEGGAVLVAEAHGRITVRAPAPFDGRICVDFGTTESAAAVAYGALREPDEGEPLAAPEILELGRVRLAGGDPDLGDRYLPTAALYAADGSSAFGDEALDARDRGLAGDRFLGQFKWRLGDEDGLGAAGDYLAHLRTLIECHPKVAALVTPQTPVVATRPTDFADGQAEALLAAFLGAGFGDPRRAGFSADQEPTLSYESWSPTILALWDDVDLIEGLDPGLAKQVSFVLPAELEAPAQVVIFDVGGGSADLSVLRIEGKAGEIHVQEVHKRTDLNFVGVKFGEMILRVLIRHVEEQGHTPDLSDRRQAMWGAAVEAIQHHPGLFSSAGMASRVQDHFGRALAGKVDYEAFKSAMQTAWGLDKGEDARASGAPNASLQEMAPHLRRLRLPILEGDALRVRLDDVVGLLIKVLKAFTDQYLAPMSAVTAELMRASGLDEIRPELTRLIPSGRGAAFPLADALILTLFEARRAAGMNIARLSPEAAKSVTSYGGQFLADVAAIDGEVKFDLGREDRRFSLVLGHTTRGSSKSKRRLAFTPVGRGAVLHLAEVDSGRLARPLRVQASWGSARNHDALPPLSVPPEARSSPDAFWLVGWRGPDGDATALVQAADAETAVIKAMEMKS